MKIAAMVPVKMNSERMPGKNLRRFSDGTALITAFLKTLVKVKHIDEIYVFCSDERVKAYCIGPVRFLKRPEWLDEAEAAPQDLIGEFMKCVDADIYLTAHCTSPFVKVKHIEEGIEAVVNGMHDSAFTAEKLRKLFWDDTLQAVNFDPEHIPRTQDLKPVYSEVSAAYIFRREVFEKLHRRIGNTPYVIEVKGTECIDIDEPEDFEMADAVYCSICRKNMERMV